MISPELAWISLGVKTSDLLSVGEPTTTLMILLDELLAPVVDAGVDTFEVAFGFVLWMERLESVVVV